MSEGQKKLALVVQRYGTKVTGGAEYHSRWVVEQLRNHFDLTIFTTTAEDYVTWESAFPVGESEIDGVKVIRFPVEEERDQQRFQMYSEWIFHERHRDVDEDRWLRMQGPYCPGLVEAVQKNKYKFDLFLFFTYLYYPTVKGIQEVGDRAVLLPTAHDEQAIRLRMYEKVFDAPRGFLLNTQEERRLIENLFDLGHRPRIVVGMGIEWPDPPPDPAPTLEKYGLKKPFAVSSGRISYGKGHDLVLKCLPAIKSDIDLVLFGKLEENISLPDDPRVHFLGFVSEEEKWALSRAAQFSIQPSLYESLSLTLLESWSMGVPVLINQGCAVLHEHVKLSGGGLTYKNEEDFPEVYERIAGDRELREKMGTAGMHYTKRNYEARTVAGKYVDFINRMIELRT